MRRINIVLSAIFLISSMDVLTQTTWPREIVLDKGTKITVYQPQPESLNGNKLVTREVVSVRKSKNEEPVFGVVWTEATISTNKDSRMATMDSINVTAIKFPDVEDQSKIESLSAILETEIPKWKLEIALDQIIATLEQEQEFKSEEFNTDPPEIIYRSEPTTLILIDGDPVVKMDDQLKMEKVLNTPFLIVKDPDGKKYYLYAGSFWYVSSEIMSGWTKSNALPASIKTLDTEIKKQEAENQKEQTASGEPAGPTAILVKTKPAELIQSKGEASFASIEGTGLLFVNNSDDNIFKNIEDQQYYILLTGRWYKAGTLEGPWSFVASDKLPADFAKIPEGSDKDVVLANVAGTDAAREAVIDAQIPQTAKVDITSTSCTVTYDGEPKFEAIEGTSLEVAVNTSATVLRSNNKYYAVEDGVWFVSDKATGPWSVSTERPADVEDIPPSNQAYNTKYVYIYETTPQYVYVGYTPGYMGCFIFGPTVIYGTGFHYNPWYGPIYYPRPVTWGFGMSYNPWTGWSMHFGFSVGFFSYHRVGYGGWWGPPVYHPPYRPPYRAGYAHHYGPRPVHYNDIDINIDHTNNVYNNRRDVTTRDVSRGEYVSNTGRGTSVSTNDRQRSGNVSNVSANPRPSTKTSNNVYSDKSGNVYQKNSSGDWQQRNNGSWESTSSNRTSSTNIDQSSQMRDRSDMRTNQATQSGSSSGSRYSSRSGGGRR
jgi:hypothetical protein